MTFTFQTRRRGPRAQSIGMAERVSRPLSVADILSEDGVKAAHDIAQADRISRDAGAMRDATIIPSNLSSAERVQIQADRIGTSVIDPRATPPDPRLVVQFGADLCLKHRVLPWRNIAGRVTVLASSPEYFLRVRDALTVIFGPVHLAMVSSDDMDTALSRVCHETLMHSAESRTRNAESCRDWDTGKADSSQGRRRLSSCHASPSCRCTCGPGAGTIAHHHNSSAFV